jgi:predicted nucleic acid-binding protein
VNAPSLRTVVLDAQALAAACRDDPVMRDRLVAAHHNQQRVVVPVIVMAEVMTGAATDTKVWHVVGRLAQEDITAAHAARAGGLRERAEQVRRKKRDLTVDAVVASVAISVTPSVVLTSDVDDLRLLTTGHDVIVLPVGV